MQSLIWLTVTISVALMYLRPAGQRPVVEGALAIGLAGLLGLVVGTMQQRVYQVVYWSVLATALAFVSTATVHLAHWTTPYAWAVLGAVTGCVVGSLTHTHWLRCTLGGGLASLTVMGLYLAFLYRLTGTSDWFDLACSAPIGAGLGLLAALLTYIHRRSVLRYDATATLLMVAIVLGNYLSRLVAPVTVLLALSCCLVGCRSPAANADPAEFEAAVEKYLDSNGMELRIKQIREGPLVEGDTATMTVSMTHRELPMPSVVWEIVFERAGGSAAGQPPGGLEGWRVVRHEVQ